MPKLYLSIELFAKASYGIREVYIKVYFIELQRRNIIVFYYKSRYIKIFLQNIN